MLMRAPPSGREPIRSRPPVNSAVRRAMSRPRPVDPAVLSPRSTDPLTIPAEYRERMAKVGGGPLARAEGIRIAQEALGAVKQRVAGVYVMPPFNRVDSALAVLEVARDRMKPIA